MSERLITTRVSPSVKEILDSFLPKRSHPALVRALLILATEALKKDPYILTEILTGAVQPQLYEMRIYKKDDEAL